MQKETGLDASLTPFLPKAAFTITHTPMDPVDTQDPGTLVVTNTQETPDGTVTETPLSTGTGTTSPTPTITASPSPSPPGPTATWNPVSTATYTPTLAPTSPPTATSAPTSTSVPPGTSPPTNTSVPSATWVPPATYPPTYTTVPTSTSPPAGCSPAGNNSYENQVINLINQERTSRGLSELSLNSSLRQAARRHSQDMACNDFFSHTGSDGSSMASRISAAGYSYSWAAENIAASSSCGFSAQSVVNMWMGSTGHRNNILSTNAVHIGVGFRCVSDGISGDLDAYYTANFGRQ